MFLLWVAGWDESHLRQIFFSLRRSLLVECWWRLKRRGLKCARLTALGQITSYEGWVSRMVGVPNLEKVRSKKDGDTQKVGPVYSPCSSYCYSSCFSCVSCCRCRCRLRLLLLLFLLFQILLSLLLLLLPQRLLLSLHELLLFLLLPLLLKYLMSVHVICIRETIAEVSAQEEVEEYRQVCCPRSSRTIRSMCLCFNGVNITSVHIPRYGHFLVLQRFPSYLTRQDEFQNRRNSWSTTADSDRNDTLNKGDHNEKNLTKKSSTK